MKPAEGRLHLPLLALLLLSLTAQALDAQVRRGRQPAPSEGWAPLAAGIKVGWDQRANAELVGGQLRIPVVRSGIFEVAPNAEVAFLAGAREYQYGADVSWVTGGSQGGLFVSAGIAWRDSVFSPDATGARQTFFGYVLGGGLQSSAGPVELEVSLRWTFLNDTTYRPTSFTVGINYPFWSPGS